MYSVTAHDPAKQHIADLMKRAMVGEHTPIGKALSDAARILYLRDALRETITEADCEAAFAPVLEMARAKYGDAK